MNVGLGFWILCCFLNSYAGHLNITNVHLQNEVVKQLKESCSLYEGYVPINYKKYYQN
ncbi:hypothetical protein HanPSC8_Chr02g0046371 [Helianthus annuus]|nr:hypothetical protein HanPSC8_Chr02g0046371 [Helianthus annuus]